MRSRNTSNGRRGWKPDAPRSDRPEVTELPVVEVARTERLRLRRLDAGDAAFVLELVNDPSWIRYLGDRNLRTLRAAKRYIDDGPVAMYAAAAA